MEFLMNYGLFLAKTITWVVGFLAVFIICFGTIAKAKLSQVNCIKFKPLSTRFFKIRNEYAEAVYDKKTLKAYSKAEKNRLKAKKSHILPRIFYITFDGDIRASQTQALSQQINAIIAIASENDKVVLKLTSGGGLVANYGLAASQLLRLRQKNIHLTVCIDSVAASGGYLMAAVANEIVAAPFAIIGSIGVLAQLPNFHRLLKQHNIDFEQVSAGEFKRTLTMFGENTEKSRLKLQSELEDIHTQFKDFIKQYRPDLNLSQTATGEYWLAEKALTMNLVDRLNSSQDELFDKYTSHDIFEVSYLTKKRLPEALTDSLSNIAVSVYEKLTASVLRS